MAFSSQSLPNRAFNLCTTIVILLLGQTHQTDIQTSIHEVQVLLQHEIDFVKGLQDLAKLPADHVVGAKENLNITFQMLKHIYADPIFNQDIITFEDRVKYCSHPINAYGILKRTWYDYEHIWKHVLNNSWPKEGPSVEIIKNLNRIAKDHFPDINDYGGACDSLVLIQDAYDLKTEDIIQGILTFDRHNSTDTALKSNYLFSWVDYNHIGTRASNWGWLDLAYGWLKIGLEKCMEHVNCYKQPLFKEMSNNFKRCTYLHNQVLTSKNPKMREKYRTFDAPIKDKIIDGEVVWDSSHSKEETSKKSRQYVPLYVPDNSTADVFGTTKTTKKYKDNFFSMCREGSSVWRNTTVDRSLRCRLYHFNDNYLRMGPFKVEEKSERPMAVVFHDFMTKSETKTYRDVDTRIFERSGVSGKAELKIRTSRQGWLREQDYRVYKGLYHTQHDTIHEGPAVEVGTRISHRIQLATQMRVLGDTASEPYQIVNYGLGGQYATHPDASGYHKDPNNPGWRGHPIPVVCGDRIATFMIYLSSVQLGGGTVFPAIGVTKDAKEGDALFWINLNLNTGFSDRLTLHGGCPVAVGSKWITNKWIQYYDQWNDHGCTLDQFGETKNILRQWRVRNSVK